MPEPSRVVVFVLGAFVREKDGAHARVIDMLDRFHADGVRTTVYSYWNHVEYRWDAEGEARFHARWPAMGLVLERCPARVKRAAGLKKFVCALWPDVAAKILSFELGGTPRWAALRRSAETILVEYAAGLFALNGVSLSKAMVETHDLNFLKVAFLSGKSAMAPTVLLNLRWEMAALSQVNCVITISPPETQFFRLLLPAITRRPTVAGPDIRYVSAWSRAKPADGGMAGTAALYDFIFVGSAYQMNARGLLDLFARYGDWLGQFRLVIAGRVCEDLDVQALADTYPNVTFIGYVDDLSSYYQQCRLALAPVEGTGVKIKVTQALAHGLPVMASASALNGLAPGYEEAVFPISRAIALRLLTDAHAYDAARLAAWQYHEKRTNSPEADLIIAQLLGIDKANRDAAQM